jgi:uncharacterized membrane protein
MITVQLFYDLRNLIERLLFATILIIGISLGLMYLGIVDKQGAIYVFQVGETLYWWWMAGMFVVVMVEFIVDIIKSTGAGTKKSKEKEDAKHN